MGSSRCLSQRSCRRTTYARWGREKPSCWARRMPCGGLACRRPQVFKRAIAFHRLNACRLRLHMRERLLANALSLNRTVGAAAHPHMCACLPLPVRLRMRLLPPAPTHAHAFACKPLFIPQPYGWCYSAPTRASAFTTACASTDACMSSPSVRTCRRPPPWLTLSEGFGRHA